MQLFPSGGGRSDSASSEGFETLIVRSHIRLCLGHIRLCLGHIYVCVSVLIFFFV
jgi:hypothetical protein